MRSACSSPKAKSHRMLWVDRKYVKLVDRISRDEATTSDAISSRFNLSFAFSALTPKTLNLDGELTLVELVKRKRSRSWSNCIIVREMIAELNDLSHSSGNVHVTQRHRRTQFRRDHKSKFVHRTK